MFSEKVDTHTATEKQIEDLEEELLGAGVPLRYRPLECFQETLRIRSGRLSAQSTIRSPDEWYLKTYGEAVRWDGIVARFPVLIRGVIYLGQARFVERATCWPSAKKGSSSFRTKSPTR